LPTYILGARNSILVITVVSQPAGGGARHCSIVLEVVSLHAIGLVGNCSIDMTAVSLPAGVGKRKLWHRYNGCFSSFMWRSWKL
jgi:hypothetical protein